MNDTGFAASRLDRSLLDAEYAETSVSFQPWLDKTPAMVAEQAAIQDFIKQRSQAKFGRGAFVAREARILTSRFEFGAGSWVAAGAVIRGEVRIGDESSINPYVQIAGKVTIGAGVRIAGMVSIYGVIHGFDRTDIPIYRQPHTQKGIVIEDGTWIGANAVILDGVRIGANSIVAPGAVVTTSFPAFQVLEGIPARAVCDRRSPEARSDAAPPPSQPVPPTQPAPAGQTPARGGGRIRSMLFDVDPYHNLEHSLPLDLQGWASTEPVFRKLIEELRPEVIVEVGTWKGASAVHMAEIRQKLGLSTEIVCVDTWLGAWQHWSRKDGVGSRVDLRLINGFPHLYYQFMSNVILKGHQDSITPLALTGVSGAKLLAHLGVQAKLVYIDGDHEYESVIADLRSWLPLVAPGGAVLGDDYEWPGVRRAAAEVVADGKWQMERAGGKFVLRPALP